MKLFQLAKRAAGAIRNALGRRSSPTPPPPPAGTNLVPPPVVRSNAPQRRPPSAQEQRDVKHVQEVYDNVQLLGRDRSYDSPGAINQLMTQMRLVNSSNVWGYFYELENDPRKPTSGILYVTFRAEAPKGGERPHSAGPTYAYYDVPIKKYKEFERASDASAGKAVWDYMRVRGAMWNHQHRYRFIQSTGDYIPRKATKRGLRVRHAQNPHSAKIPNSVWSAISRLKRSVNSEIREYAEKMRSLLLQEAGHRRSTKS